MEEIIVKLDGKEDLVHIIVALAKAKYSTMVRNEELINLIERLMAQASELMTPEEARELVNAINLR
ncbi:hypothetical protein [Peribacillus asahii]|uniref:hypothetical protein n=1 Tax=Peribacillus asahii TaxID=228899 RepID=UPI00381F32A8